MQNLFDLFSLCAVVHVTVNSRRAILCSCTPSPSKYVYDWTRARWIVPDSDVPALSSRKLRLKIFVRPHHLLTFLRPPDRCAICPIEHRQIHLCQYFRVIVNPLPEWPSLCQGNPYCLCKILVCPFSANILSIVYTSRLHLFRSAVRFVFFFFYNQLWYFWYVII